MTDDRDRRRVEEWTWARGGIVHRDLTDSLVSLLVQARSEARAEGAAEAIEAAARVVCTANLCREPSCLARRIRALAPTGLVAVSRADLELVLPLAEGGPADYQQPSEWRDANRRLRDAVARKEG